MRKSFLHLVAVILGFIVTLLGLQQKIYADSEYPHTDVQDNPLLCFIIGGFVIAIIVVSAYILLRIRNKNRMKRLESQVLQERQATMETEATEATEESEKAEKVVETEATGTTKKAVETVDTVGAEKTVETVETVETKQDE